jgi:hypothetical protein
MVSTITVLSFIFAYLTCKLYIIFIDNKNKKQEEIQPLLGVVYPKDEND